MCFDFRTNAVLQGCNDFAPSSVVFGVRGKNDNDVERQPYRVALNLNVPFLHDIEQTDLNFSGKIRQLIDGEDTAVRTWEQAVVDAQLAADRMSPFCRLDRIDISDNVGNGYVRCSEFFDIAFVPTPILDRRSVALFLNEIATSPAYRTERIVVNLTTGNNGQRFIQEVGKTA